MQRNTTKILEQMNYEEAEPNLLSYFIISYDERKNLMRESRDQKLYYIIEKVIRGTEETFNNFLKALEESRDDSNYKLMVHLQQAHQKKEEESFLSLSEMSNTPCGSMRNELVFGEMSFQPQSSLQYISKTESKASSCNATHALHSGLPNQYTTKTEKTMLTASLNFQRSSSPINITSGSLNCLELSSDSWVVVYTQTNITYNKNLTFVMEYICEKVTDSLTGTNCVQSTFTQLHNLKFSIRLPKEVYLAADPEVETAATRAADDQIQQTCKELIKLLHRLQSTSYPRINIDLSPILKRICYTPNKAILSEYSIESLIQAVEKLNQTTIHRPCVIL